MLVLDTVRSNYQVEEVDSPTLRSPSFVWPCALHCTAPSSAAPAAAAPPCRCWCGAGRWDRSAQIVTQGPPGSRCSSWSDSPVHQQPANRSGDHINRGSYITTGASLMVLEVSKSFLLKYLHKAAESNFLWSCYYEWQVSLIRILAFPTLSVVDRWAICVSPVNFMDRCDQNVILLVYI